MPHTNQPTPPKETFKREFQPTSWTVLSILIFVSFVSLKLRAGSFGHSLAKYLWAEDGNIFLNQSQSPGISAIVVPYAGYLHLYPRLIAELSSFFDLLHRPAVLVLGWLLSYLVLVHALAKSLPQGIGRLPALVALTFLVTLQPNHGEVFFNITNSQWLIGAALFLHGLSDSPERGNYWPRFALFLILSLTGPFCIVLAPLLMLKLAIGNDSGMEKSKYHAVFLGALIQLGTLLSSDRISTGGINKDPGAWFSAFASIVTFGADRPISKVCALSAWLLVAYLVISNTRRGGPLKSQTQTAAALLTSAFLLVLAGLFSHKHEPTAIIALGGGNRYTWVPYTLIMAASILLSGYRKRILAVFCALFGVIFFINFHRVEPQNLQFESFAKFSKTQDVSIPINPQTAQFPGWHIEAKSTHAAGSEPLEFGLNSENFVTTEIKSTPFDGGLKITATGPDPAMIFIKKISCTNHTDAATSIHITRGNPGWMQLFWSSTGQFSERQSLRRWYPSGDVEAQFAFPISSKGTQLRFDPMEGNGSAHLRKMEIFCL